MKTIIKITIAIFLICLSVNSIFAQASEKEIAKEFYRADGNINIVLNNLPKGWNFKEEKGFFIITRNDSVISLTENTTNPSSEKKEDRIARIKEHGKKILAKIVIKYEAKWDFLKTQEAQLKNASTIEELNKLADKMKITALLDPVKSKKNQAVYTAKNEADKTKIANYYKEKEKLEKKIVITPDYNSKDYSLFKVSTEGMEDDNTLVYPVSASIELYSILALFREACGK